MSSQKLLLSPKERASYFFCFLLTQTQTLVGSELRTLASTSYFPPLFFSLSLSRRNCTTYKIRPIAVTRRSFPVIPICVFTQHFGGKILDRPCGTVSLPLRQIDSRVRADSTVETYRFYNKNINPFRFTKVSRYQLYLVSFPTFHNSQSRVSAWNKCCCENICKDYSHA